MEYNSATHPLVCRLIGRRGIFPAVLALLAILPVVLLPGCEPRGRIRPTPQMEAGSQFWVRVLLVANTSECTVSIPSSFQVAKADLGLELGSAQPARGPLEGQTKVTLVRSQLMLGAMPLAGREVVLSPASPYVFNLNGQDYRGKLKLVINSGGQTFDVLNLVPLEPYLAGVVGEEMPNYWEPQALRAQAIAARTYCLYIKNRFGVNRNYDVNRTQASQVYGGIAAESPQVWSAVNGTLGKVLIEENPGANRDSSSDMLGRGVFPAYFSSVCGGHTSDGREVFGDSFASLKGVACPYCKDVARLGLFFWPMAQFSRKTVTDQLTGRYPRLKSLGEIREIVVDGKIDYDRFSRLTRIKLVGATGKTESLRAEDLRLAIDPTGRRIKSTVCHIVPWGDGWAFLSGRGWGHGVGMCQCGAEGMARGGSSAEEILQHYYPGARIVSIY